MHGDREAGGALSGDRAVVRGSRPGGPMMSRWREAVKTIAHARFRSGGGLGAARARV